MSSKLTNTAVLALAISLACLGTIPAQGAETVATLSLSGGRWWIHDDADGTGAQHGMPEADVAAPGWISATVPGNIQADLEAAHRLKPLWCGLGDPGLHEVARKDWWYRRDFVAPESFTGRRITLVFDGVDHECEVWCNGRKMGGNAGMFKRFWFDVTDLARPGQTNRLAVKISRMPAELEEVVLSADAPGGPNVGKASNAVRQRLKELKSPTNNAWDWSVAVYTLGIWRDARLEATGPARIDWTRVQTELKESHSKAMIRATLQVDSFADMKARAHFNITGHGAKATRTREIRLATGRNVVEAEIPLDAPALWWPNGHGEQPLYHLQAELTASDSGELLDRRTTRFGVREIRWDQVPGAPADFVNPLKLVVNGRAVRQMGSNLVPPDALFGRIAQRGPRLLRLAQAAGINCLRLWGGGVILPEEMYDLADELGIMLLAEFPLANCTPETDPVFLKNLENTVRNIIAQTRNHPCIVEWTGGNEMPWANGTRHPALQLLEKLVREEDGRIFRATEPAQGSGPHGTYTYVYHTEPAGYLSWLGAGAQNLYQRYDTSVEMRISEFGTHSPANLEVWHRTIPPGSQWPLADYSDPVLIRKNVFWGAVLKENWLHKEITERLFGPLAGLDQLVQAGQFLGAEGLRYAMDALRRKGPALGGGFMSWNYNEPWPNGAGSYMVDYDGRPLMNYDFVTQALTPVSLSLKYPSLLYDSAQGVTAQLFLASDAPETARKLRWHWQSRDRRGKVFSRGSGVADSIEPQGVIPLAPVTLRPPPETALGPVFIELGLDDANGRTLVERLHVFGATALQAPLAGLLANGLQDRDDTGAEVLGPRSLHNLAWVGNGAAQATASAELPGYEIHRAKGLNDGVYGNAHSWIGGVPAASLQIELGRMTEISRFRLGRDRTGGFADRPLDELKIETSADGQAWKTVFERQGLSALPGYRPTATMEIQVAPIRAKWVRATVNPANACLDEVEVYPPTDGLSGELPWIGFEVGLPPRPVARTTIDVEAQPVRIEGEQEVLDLVVRNSGPMTALFCEAHSLIEYRTDLFIRNNHVSIPPGETRTLTIRSAAHPAGGLSLAQTGWRITAWNADERVIDPAPSVLLALGRRDAMCREFDGYLNPGRIAGAARVRVEGTRPDPARLPYLLDGKGARFEFPASEAQARHPARLRIHTADQSADTPTKALATINGRRLEGTLPRGLGIQRPDPAHLAFPATVEFRIPARDLRTGKNTLEVSVEGDGWFSWDAMQLLQWQ
jgi:beta-mannosidase